MSTSARDEEFQTPLTIRPRFARPDSIQVRNGYHRCRPHPVEQGHDEDIIDVHRRLGGQIQRRGEGERRPEPDPGITQRHQAARDIERPAARREGKPLPRRLVVSPPQPGGADPTDEISAVDRLGAQGQRPVTIGSVDVIVIALKREATFAEATSELMELVERLVADEMSPPRATPLPNGRVDEHGHRRTVPDASTCETVDVSSVVDEVQLRVPARPEFGRIIRVGGAALGLRQGLSFAEIDELRLAIDEAVILLLDRGSGQGEIEARFRFDGDRLDLEIRQTRCTESLHDAAVDRFDEICGPLIDDYDIDPARSWLRLRKTPAPLD